jgi:hypothetical protein
MLEQLLEKLNAAVAEHNAEVDECVATGELTEATAAGLRWLTPITRDTVQSVKSHGEWPAALLNIVNEMHTPIHAREVIKLAKSAKAPTTITQELCRGAARSKGAKDDNYAHPVFIKTIQAAHLFARAEQAPPAPPESTQAQAPAPPEVAVPAPPDNAPTIEPAAAEV